MSSIQRIADEAGIALPEVYTNLAQNGMLDWGSYGPAWSTRVLPELARRPPLLLFTRDYEGLGSEAAAEAFEDLYADDDYRGVDSAQTLLLPFAQSGAGDLYCFDFSAPEARADTAPAPVVFAWHDRDRLETLAPSFTAFVFRQLLTAALIVEGDFSYVDVGAGYRANLAALLDSHRPLLDEERIGIVGGVFSREPRTSENGQAGLLYEAEWRQLVQLHTGIDPEDQPTRPYFGAR